EMAYRKPCIVVKEPDSDEYAGRAWKDSETDVLTVAVSCAVASQAAGSSAPKTASTVPTTSSPAWLMPCHDSVVTQTTPECEYHSSATPPCTVRSTEPMVTASPTCRACSSAMVSESTTPSPVGSALPAKASDAVRSTSPEPSGMPHTATVPE